MQPEEVGTEMVNAAEDWYVIKQVDGHCAIASADQLPEREPDKTNPTHEQWGPYATQGEAIARRVGLIRAGKCKPN